MSKLISRKEFAKAIGVTPQYLSTKAGKEKYPYDAVTDRGWKLYYKDRIPGIIEKRTKIIFVKE